MTVVSGHVDLDPAADPSTWEHEIGCPPGAAIFWTTRRPGSESGQTSTQPFLENVFATTTASVRAKVTLDVGTLSNYTLAGSEFVPGEFLVDWDILEWTECGWIFDPHIDATDIIRVHYMAMSGATAQYALLPFTLPADGSGVAITGSGFGAEPIGAFSIWTGVADNLVDTDGGAYLGFGVCDAALTQWWAAIGVHDRNVGDPKLGAEADEGAFMEADGFVHSMEDDIIATWDRFHAVPTAPQPSGSVASFDADGITLSGNCANDIDGYVLLVYDPDADAGFQVFGPEHWESTSYSWTTGGFVPEGMFAVATSGNTIWQDAAILVGSQDASDAERNEAPPYVEASEFAMQIDIRGDGIVYRWTSQESADRVLVKHDRLETEDGDVAITSLGASDTVTADAVEPDDNSTVGGTGATYPADNYFGVVLIRLSPADTTPCSFLPQIYRRL